MDRRYELRRQAGPAPVLGLTPGMPGRRLVFGVDNPPGGKAGGTDAENAAARRTLLLKFERDRMEREREEEEKSQ